MTTHASGKHQVVIVGGGFGGLEAAKALRGSGVEITLVDRRNFHLFQPLAYQVATGALSAGEVAFPLRAIFDGDPDVWVLLAEVTGIDLDARRLDLRPELAGAAHHELRYDSLIVAGGCVYSYFGNEGWREHAPDIKSLESALEVRRRILGSFEAAELEPDPAARAAWQTFVVVGAGPTGVEMAGQIAEIARDTLPGDYRRIDPTETRILLVEMGDRVLAGFPPGLSAKATASLEHLGVTPLTGHRVVTIDDEGIEVERPGGERERIPARTKVWAAGVRASPLAELLAQGARATTDKAGRVTVERDLSLAGHSEVMALGDMVAVRGADGEPHVLPGLAPVAMQQGRYAARRVRHRLAGRTTRAFHYRNKGNLATIGRGRAVADLRFLRLSGPVAWLAWLVIHLFYLIGFQNRLVVVLRWTFSFVSRGRGARLITGRPASGGAE